MARNKTRIPYGKQQTNERSAAAKVLKKMFPNETRGEIDRVLWAYHMADPDRTRRQLIRKATELFMERL